MSHVVAGIANGGGKGVLTCHGKGLSNSVNSLQDQYVSDCVVLTFKQRDLPLSLAFRRPPAIRVRRILLARL